jgi:broad specificity phosphatase PhoE
MPLSVKQFRIGKDRWQNEDGSWASDYAEKLFKTSGFETSTIIKRLADDFEHGVEGSIDPDLIAKEQLDGIQRLKDFLGKIFVDRDITIGIVGHSPNIEILARYLAKNNQAIPDEFAFPEAGIMTVKFENGIPVVSLPK